MSKKTLNEIAEEDSSLLISKADIEQAEYFAEEAKKLDIVTPDMAAPVMPYKKPKTLKQLKARAKNKRARKARKIHRR